MRFVLINFKSKENTRLLKIKFPISKMPSNIRPLHFVFKIANRTKAIEFYKELLDMSILRHEEFEQGCDAACNGPYDGTSFKYYRLLLKNIYTRQSTQR
jgi:hypothetical protein